MKSLFKPCCGLLLSSFASVAMANEGGLPDYDANGDGQTTQSELQAGRTAEFSQIDTSGDSKLTLGELQDWFAAKTTAHFKALDADGNGSLSATEFASDPRARGHQAFTARLFKLADTDANNALSAEEFKAAFAGTDRAIHLFAHLDSNDDNAISLDEFLAMPVPPQIGHRGQGGIHLPPPPDAVQP